MLIKVCDICRCPDSKEVEIPIKEDGALTSDKMDVCPGCSIRLLQEVLREIPVSQSDSLHKAIKNVASKAATKFAERPIRWIPQFIADHEDGK